MVRCAVGETDGFKVGVRLQQGSSLCPFLFAVVLVRQESLSTEVVVCTGGKKNESQ